MERFDAVFRESQAGSASQLKTDERASVNYARRGKQRVATRIAISPSGKRLRLGLAKSRGAIDTAAY